MKIFNRLLSTVFAVLIVTFSTGCGIDKIEITQNSGESYSFVSPESSQKSEAGSESAAKAYTMADVKKLKNTEHFAKNTLEHIFDGTINGKGKATGYHYSKVSDSKGKIIDGTRSGTDKNGVFTGKVEVSGVKKNGFSSFYPESWTPQQVVDAINEAYENALSDPNNPQGSIWIGFCDNPKIEIDMYLNSNKQITTAFPVYEGD